MYEHRLIYKYIKYTKITIYVYICFFNVVVMASVLLLYNINFTRALYLSLEKGNESLLFFACLLSVWFQ